MAEKEKVTMVKYLNNVSTRNYIKGIISSPEKADMFMNNMLTLTDKDIKLQECDPGDLMRCALNAVALDLPLSKQLGLAYVIAYKGSPTFQVGYKGFIQLAIRTQAYKRINACEVREGEIERNKFTGEIKFLKECPDAPVVGYMAYLLMHSGFEQSFYMSVEQVRDHAKKYSPSYKYSNTLWHTDEAKMATKTVLKLLLSQYGLLSPELQKALESDENIEVEKGKRAINIDDIQKQDDKNTEVKQNKETIDVEVQELPNDAI
jgi:recombination protein RecT